MLRYHNALQTCTTIYIYYQFEKARIAKDNRAQLEIMIATDPANMKRIGDDLNMDEVKEQWSTIKEPTMEKALFAKFSQNRHLRKALLGYGDKTLVEASRDRFWGSGMPLKDPMVLSDKDWTGKNTLGSLLTNIKSQVKDLD